jgi:protein gp37
MANRLRGRYGYPAHDPFRVTFHPDRLKEPLRRKKPRRIFVCSMADIFHGDVKVEWIDNILEVIAACPQHIFLMLTKRPQNIEEKFYGEASARVLGGGDYLPNLWLGVTAENQTRADERIPILLQIPAAVRFVSLEPLLGPVLTTQARRVVSVDGENVSRIHWMIAGGETGPGARPMHPNWVRSLRDQCIAADVPFFFKGWGEFVFSDDGSQPIRIGKKRAGNLLDGRAWTETPLTKFNESKE